ncbi:MAG TPA: phosphoribosylaminoimidazolesuccinocarboxamide synthase [Candidatus Limnocylindrales bacterium]
MLAEAFLRSGKVRDLYRLGGGRLALVASDRISAFDVVLPTVIPDKGRVLTGLSRFWFAETADIVPNHLLDTDPMLLVEGAPAGLENAGQAPPGIGLDELRGRIMICRPATVLPIEAVVRGYLSGSGWKEYREHGSVCGVPLPVGLRESDLLPQPIFTPATKAELGAHDENISFDRMVDHLATSMPDLGDRAGGVAERVRDLSFGLYRRGSAIAERAGILLADTKFEFGIVTSPGDEATGHAEEQVILIDEVLTPDSSRFWDAGLYEPGRAQPSFDKQFVRDWLETQPWNKSAPGPALPDDVVAGTRARYVAAFERITGASFRRYLEEDVIAP